jgi:hypothetical protein
MNCENMCMGVTSMVTYARLYIIGGCIAVSVRSACSMFAVGRLEGPALLLYCLWWVTGVPVVTRHLRAITAETDRLDCIKRAHLRQYTLLLGANGRGLNYSAPFFPVTHDMGNPDLVLYVWDLRCICR